MHLPTQIYILWKSGDPTCFEIKLGAFSMAFSMCMSGNILCLISIDRYITIAHRKHYQRITKKSLTISIILMILISFIWATFEADFNAKVDIKNSETLLCPHRLRWNSNSTCWCFQCSFTKTCKGKEKNISHKSKSSRFQAAGNRFHFIKNNSNYCGCYDSCLFTNNDNINWCSVCINKLS